MASAMVLMKAGALMSPGWVKLLEDLDQGAAPGFAVNSADRTWDDMGRIEKLTLPIFPHLSPSPIFGDRLLMHVSSI